MPASTPPITMPTTRPRCAGGTSPIAYGKIICVTDAPSPTSTAAIASIHSADAAANTSSAAAQPIEIVTIVERRSRTSPSGTISNMPTAYPSCMPTSAEPTLAWLAPSACAITSASGCA